MGKRRLARVKSSDGVTEKRSTAEEFASGFIDVHVEGSVCPLGRGRCDYVSSCDDVLSLGHDCPRVR